MPLEAPDEYTLTEAARVADMAAVDRGLIWAEAALNAAREEASRLVVQALQDLRCGRQPQNDAGVDAHTRAVNWRECRGFLRGVRLGRSSAPTLASAAATAITTSA